MAEYIATSQWIKFFTKAGLPSNAAANYAIIFSDNRIQMDMLMDLSKEYLYDMGIRLMGDVIAILRHAKETHNQLAKEKVIGDCSEITPSPTSTKRNTPVSRMMGHYIRSSVNNSPTTVSLDVCQPLPNSSLSEKGANSRLRALTVPFPSDSNSGKANVISLKRKLDVPVTPEKRVRRVLPEEEGAYKIKLPSGTTERSRKILQQKMQLEQKSQGFKRSVFDRLGDSAVSSSTDSSSKTSTIFGRLGPLGNSEVSTSSATSEGVGTHLPLQYQGVLKGGTNRRTVATGSYPIVKIIGSSSSAVMREFGLTPTSVSTVSTTSTKSSNLTLASRLSRALKKSLNNKNLSHGIFGDASSTRVMQNVKSRLGISSSSIMSIKDRLGGRPAAENAVRLNTRQLTSGLRKPVLTGKRRNDIAIQNVFQRLGH